MDLLQLLVVLVVGVILGYWLQNPALADRERAVRQKLRRAKLLQSDASVKLAISQDQLRLVQAVREQTNAMLDFATRAPELGPTAVAWEPSPIFDGMLGWLKPTGTMPALEAPSVDASVDSGDAKTAAVDEEPTPKARDRFPTKPRKKVTVQAVPEAPAELVEVAG